MSFVQSVPLQQVEVIIAALVYSVCLACFAASFVALTRARGFHVRGRIPSLIWSHEIALLLWLLYLGSTIGVEVPCEVSKLGGFLCFPILMLYVIRAAKLVFARQISSKLAQFHNLPINDQTEDAFFQGRDGWYVRHRDWVKGRRLVGVCTVYLLLHASAACASAGALCPSEVASTLASALAQVPLTMLFVCEVIILGAMLLCHRHGEDSLHMKEDLIVNAWLTILAVVSTIVLVFLVSTFAATLNQSIFLTLVACFNIWYPVILDRKIPVMGSKVIFTLEQILDDSKGFQSFALFLQQEFSAENVYFYQRIKEFKSLPTDPERQGAAEYLWDTFIAGRSPFQVNLSAQTVKAIAEVLHKPLPRGSFSMSKNFFSPLRRGLDKRRALDNLSKTHMPRSSSHLPIALVDSETLRALFDEAQNQVLLLMQRDSFPRYVQSALYEEWEKQATIRSASGSFVEQQIEQTLRDISVHSRTKSKGPSMGQAPQRLSAQPHPVLQIQAGFTLTIPVVEIVITPPDVGGTGAEEDLPPPPPRWR